MDLVDVNAGWVKLYRSLLDKPIWVYSTPEQKVVLITTLGLASYSEKQWEWQGKKFICNPGQFITSSTSLAKRAGVTRQNVRTALKRFQKYEFLTYESTKTGILITLTNWEEYQAKPEELTNNLTITQPTPNQRLTNNLTTIKNNKNDKKKYTPESQECILAEYLLKKIRENNPDFKQPNIENWALGMNRLIRIDKRSHTEVKALIDYSQEDEFWRTNILSPDKLRKQYDQLKIQSVQRQKNKKPEIISGSSVPLGSEVPSEWR